MGTILFRLTLAVLLFSSPLIWSQQLPLDNNLNEPDNSDKKAVTKPSDSQILELPLWFLGSYTEKISAVVLKMADVIEGGMLPVGLQVSRSIGAVVLYAWNTKQTPVSQALIKELKIDDFEALSNEVSQLISSGFVPFDISHDDDGLFILFLDVPFKLEAWRIERLNYNLTDMQGSIANWEAAGFEAWGVSIHKDDAWILFIKPQNKNEISRSTLNAYRYDASVFTQAINNSVRSLLYPWGLSIAGEEIIIHYRD